MSSTGTKRPSVLAVATAFALTGVFVTTGSARAADPPSSSDVLGKLHEANLKEIAMGKLAQKNGDSKDVKTFGKTLVKDHSAADKKVLALAKQEKIDLPAAKPAMDDGMTKAKGADFDSKFAKDMLDDHKKDVEETTSARDATTDPKLKSLLTELVPTLQKHKDTAQKLVDNTTK
jgi:putative membrane protein